MNALKYIRSYYLVEAHQGHRIRFGVERPVMGTILGGKNGRLRVKLDGQKKTVLLHPTFEMTYIQTSAPSASPREHS